jgi:hypothetical protein
MTPPSKISGKFYANNGRRIIGAPWRRLSRSVKRKQRNVHPRHRLDHARPKRAPGPDQESEEHASATSIHHFRHDRRTVEGTGWLISTGTESGLVNRPKVTRLSFRPFSTLVNGTSFYIGRMSMLYFGGSKSNAYLSAAKIFALRLLH